MYSSADIAQTFFQQTFDARFDTYDLEKVEVQPVAGPNVAVSSIFLPVQRELDLSFSLQYSASNPKPMIGFTMTLELSPAPHWETQYALSLYLPSLSTFEVDGFRDLQSGKLIILVSFPYPIQMNEEEIWGSLLLSEFDADPNSLEILTPGIVVLDNLDSTH